MTGKKSKRAKRVYLTREELEQIPDHRVHSPEAQTISLKDQTEALLKTLTPREEKTINVRFRDVFRQIDSEIQAKEKGDKK